MGATLAELAHRRHGELRGDPGYQITRIASLQANESSACVGCGEAYSNWLKNAAMRQLDDMARRLKKLEPQLSTLSEG